jgi:hypothetical protein
MTTFSALGRRFSKLGAVAAVSLFCLASSFGQTPARNPGGKIYVASLTGVSQSSSGETIEALTPKSIFPAAGSRIETKPSGTLSMVFSNGTGIFLDQDTHIEIKQFTQESFFVNRTNLELEPSVSATEVYLSQGTLAVSTSKLAPGSVVSFRASLGSINLRGGKVVLEITGDELKISLLDGEGTVHGGKYDLGGHVLHAGEQAIILPGPAGESNLVKIRKIPAEDLAAIEVKAAMAYEARKTVFFEQDPTTGEIIAVPVVPTTLPVPATVSPSRLPG